MLQSQSLGRAFGFLKVHCRLDDRRSDTWGTHRQLRHLLIHPNQTDAQNDTMRGNTHEAISLKCHTFTMNGKDIQLQS